MYKIIVAGGRDFDDWDYFISCMSQLMNSHKARGNYTIVSGGQKSTDHTTGDHYGADYFGEQWAEINNLIPIICEAEWKKYGKAAGPIRNQEMADISDILIAFWNGKSRGTKNMIQKAFDSGLEIHVYRY